MVRTVRSYRCDFRHKADECRITFEDHVELAELVTLHAVRTLRIELVPIHVTVDALNHRRASQIAFQIAKPIFRMRRAQRRGILFDKGLKNTVDMSADRFAISRPIVLNVHGRTVWFDRGDQSNTKSKREK